MSDISKCHEWELARRHQRALTSEDFETCSLIQKEIDERTASGTLDESLMNGFKYWNPKTAKFEGEPNYQGMNGLFDKYLSGKQPTQ